MLPTEITSLLVAQEVPITPSLKRECEGARFHSPRPLTTHWYNIAKGRNVWLCGTCRDNLLFYVYLYDIKKGLDWPVQRTFGNQIRSLATQVIENRRVKND